MTFLQSRFVAHNDIDADDADDDGNDDADDDGNDDADDDDDVGGDAE